jgi:hypothetical protein
MLAAGGRAGETAARLHQLGRGPRQCVRQHRHLGLVGEEHRTGDSGSVAAAAPGRPGQRPVHELLLWRGHGVTAAHRPPPPRPPPAAPRLPPLDTAGTLCRTAAAGRPQSRRARARAGPGRAARARARAAAGRPARPARRPRASLAASRATMRRAARRGKGGAKGVREAQRRRGPVQAGSAVASWAQRPKQRGRSCKGAWRLKYRVAVGGWRLGRATAHQQPRQAQLASLAKRSAQHSLHVPHLRSSRRNDRATPRHQAHHADKGAQLTAVASGGQG